MIRVFLPTEKKFETNGEIVVNATRCTVKNAIGGDYSLEMICPIEYIDYIKPQNILVVPTPQGAQPFRIYSVTKNLHKLTAKAKHLTFDAENYIIADSFAVDKTAQEALDHFNRATDTESPFEVFSDVEGINSQRIVRESLNGAIKAVSDRWGGVVIRDGWKISVLSSIERDNGITIEYGKNLQEISADYNFSNTVTKVLPVGKDGILLDERYLTSSTQYEIPYTKVISFDQDIEAEDYETETEYKDALKDDLRAQAEDYLEKYCVPSVNYTLKGKPERVSDIGDLILVRDKRLDIELVTEVISYEFDAIMERYNSLQFGNFTDSLNNLLENIQKAAEKTAKETAEKVPSQCYPVGSVYSTIKNMNPNALFGGVWEVLETVGGVISWLRTS